MEFQTAISSVVDRISKSIVAVMAETLLLDDYLNLYPVRGFGSGFFIDRRLVVTAYHVVSNAESVHLILPEGDVSAGSVLGFDEENDVALLKVDSSGLPVELGSVKDVKVGQVVLAFGYPLGMTDRPTVTMGVISSIGRAIRIQGRVLEGLIQTDASINPGNSGGPLATIDGKVIGVNTAIVAGAQGIGFAIPIDIVKLTVQQILWWGRVLKPKIGVFVVPISKYIARIHKLSVSKGLLVVDVVPGSPAYELGIRPGDVITSVDGEHVSDTFDLKVKLLNALNSGRNEVLVGVRRLGRELELAVPIVVTE